MGARDRQTVVEEKVFDYGTIDYLTWTLGAYGGGTEVKIWYDRIFHNLGYVPSYEAYLKVPAEDIFNDEGGQLFQKDYYYVPLGATYSYGQADPAGGATISFVSMSGADEQYFYVGRWAQNVNAYPVSAAGGSVKWFIKSLTAT